MQISENFKLEEFTRSATATHHKIDNTKLTDEILDNIKYLTTNLLQPLRTAWGDKIIITSGYRCKKLNDLVFGSKTSEHLKGLAVDICPRHGRMKEFQEFVQEFLETHEYNQCIFEKPHLHIPQWIHLSLSRKNNKRQTFEML